MDPSLLIVDGDTRARHRLRERFARDGYLVAEAGSAAEALAQVNPAVDLVLLDLRLFDGADTPSLSRITDLAPDTLIIVMATPSMVDTTTQAMRLGAHNYISKPVVLDEAAVTVGHALETSRLRRELRLMRSNEGRQYGFDAIIGSSPPMLEVKALLARVATSPTSTVLLVGETGTGKDLFYRLKVMSLHLPPLRERTGDVEALLHHYIARYNAEFAKHVIGPTPQAMVRLARHDWPGNIRELRNVVERAMLVLDGRWIRLEDLPVLGRHRSIFQLPADGLNLEDLECQLLVQALERARGNQTCAARMLGMNRDQVRYRIEKFNLPPYLHTRQVEITT